MAGAPMVPGWPVGLRTRRRGRVGGAIREGRHRKLRSLRAAIEAGGMRGYGAPGAGDAPLARVSVCASRELPRGRWRRLRCLLKVVGRRGARRRSLGWNGDV